MGGIQCFLAWQPLHSSHCLDSDIYLSEIWSGHRAIETTEMRQRYWGRGEEVFCVQSSRLFTLSFCPLPIDWWTSCFKLTLRSVSPLWSQELHYTMMAQDDDMMKMSISIYFKCQCRLPPYTPCVSIASCHSARGEEGQEQQIFIKYLSRANFTILPSLLICSRYLLICWDLFVCSFASISANVGDLLVSEARPSLSSSCAQHRHCVDWDVCFPLQL